MTQRFSMWVLALLAAVLSAGCGGGASYKAQGGAPTSAGGVYTASAESDDAAYGDDEAAEAPMEPAPMADRAEAPGRPGAAPVVGKKAAKAPDPAPPPPQVSGAGGGTPPADEPSVATPLLIYKANLVMAVFEATAAIDKVETLARDTGGYLVRRDDRTITVRVPAAKFQGSLDALTKLGDVLHRNVDVRDVTEEYTDLKIRLRNAEVVRVRLEKLLERADHVDDALAVERELERVAGEIERIKGRLKLLDELIGFSTITVEFRPQQSEHIRSTVRLPFPWLDQLGLGDLLRL